MIGLVLICALLTTVPPVLSANLFLSGEIEPNPACQEETVTIDVTCTNQAEYQIKLTWLGIHFDWQLDNHYYTALDKDVIQSCRHWERTEMRYSK